MNVEGDKLVKTETWDGKTATLTYELVGNQLVAVSKMQRMSNRDLLTNSSVTLIADCPHG